MKLRYGLLVVAASLMAVQAGAQTPRAATKAAPKAAAGVAGKTAAQLAPGQNCQFLTAAHAAESAGDPNVNHDGSPLPGVTPPDISKGFNGIPRSAQPALTASQRRILECTYHLNEANADMPYTLFIPSTYDPSRPTPLIVDLHGLNITPLQQILFDGTTDNAERFGYIVVAPMGFSLGGWWGSRPMAAVPTAQTKPGTSRTYVTGELSEMDAMNVLATVRGKYNIDNARIYLTGHSMGGAGTYYLGGAHSDIWAGLAPMSGANGLANAEAAQKVKNIPMLIMHGEKDSIVSPDTSRRSVMNLQSVGGQVIYLQSPGSDHEFWIRRGARNIEKVFMFFNTVSKTTQVGVITPEMAAAPARAGGGGGGGRGGPGAPGAPGRGGPPAGR